MTHKKITVDGIEYTAKPEETVRGTANPYVICRTEKAGVFAGYLESKKGRTVIMRDVRRLWYWEGAASLSQLAMEGVSTPEKCKFPCEVDREELFQVIEILSCTEKARENIANVAIWKH